MGGRAKTKQAEVAEQQTTDLPADKTQRAIKPKPASKVGERSHTQLPVQPVCSIPVQSRGCLINYFVNESFLVALETLLKGEGKIPPHPIF